MRRNDPKLSYTVYLAKNDTIIATGTAQECSEQMGCKNIDSFYSIVSKCRLGKHHKYDIVVESEPTNDGFGTCFYNEQIRCTNPIGCDSCGWNPEVTKKRIQKLFRR